MPRDAGYAPGQFVTVSPPAGPIACQYLDASGATIRAEMGTPSFASARIPVLTSKSEALDLELQVGGRTLTVHCVSMGNPHAVFLVPRLDRELLLELGPLLETHALFPNRSNVQMASVKSRTALELEIWERGAGYTLASGTSSCAATAVCQRLGLLDESVTVSMAGGQALVERVGATLHLTGGVCPVFSGVAEPAWLEARGLL